MLKQADSYSCCAGDITYDNKDKPLFKNLKNVIRASVPGELELELLNKSTSIIATNEIQQFTERGLWPGRITYNETMGFV
jgi:hypothetical protein